MINCLVPENCTCFASFHRISKNSSDLKKFHWISKKFIVSQKFHRISNNSSDLKKFHRISKNVVDSIDIVAIVDNIGNVDTIGNADIVGDVDIVNNIHVGNAGIVQCPSVPQFLY